jgi:hypothetical protein
MKRIPLFGCVCVGILLVGLVLGPTGPACASHEFLWKPVSENSSKLVILFPKTYRLETVQRVTVEGKTGTTKASSLSQTGANGDRIHARFGVPGASFGKNISVTLHFKNGTQRTWSIPDGAKRFTVQGGGTGDPAPSTDAGAGATGTTPGSGGGQGGGTPPFTGLDAVLGTGGTATNARITLTDKAPGQREITLAADETLEAIVCLRTYGPATLEVTINGEPWISWSRQNDADPSACRVDGQERADSMYEEKPGDFSARPITVKRAAKAGDVIAASLQGRFGPAEACLVVK